MPDISPRVEAAARALARELGRPEHWRSYLSEVTAVLAAADEAALKGEDGLANELLAQAARERIRWPTIPADRPIVEEQAAATLQAQQREIERLRAALGKEGG